MRINEEIKDQYPWGAEREWTERTKIIASTIPPGSSVIDLGGGMCHLSNYLVDCQYLSLDREAWTDHTIKADFNAGCFPQLKNKYKYIVAQGIIEYLNNPADFLEQISKYGDNLIISYLEWMNEPQKKIGRVFSTSIREVSVLIRRSGWIILFQRRLPKNQVIFYCRRRGTLPTSSQ